MTVLMTILMMICYSNILYFLLIIVMSVFVLDPVCLFIQVFVLFYDDTVNLLLHSPGPCTQALLNLSRSAD